MPILNYTTAVPLENTLSAITTLLVKKGARSINQEYDAKGRITGLAFVMPVGGLPVRFLLPNRVEGVYQVMLNDPGRRRAHRGRPTMEQAERVSWRILKDWVEAQLALIESGQAEMGQVFMPYATQQDGRTMYELWFESNRKQLGAGSKEP